MKFFINLTVTLDRGVTIVEDKHSWIFNSHLAVLTGRFINTAVTPEFPHTLC